MTRLYLLLSLLYMGLLLTAQNTFQLRTTTFEPQEESVSSFESYTLVSLDHAAFRDMWAQPFNQFQVDLNGLGPSDLSFDLNRWELRSSRYQLVLQEDGRIESQLLPSAQFRGQLSLDGGGRAVFTISENFLMAYWEQGGREYYLEPLWRYESNAPRDVYLLYTADEAIAPEGVCGGDHSAPDEDVDQPAEHFGQQRMMTCVDFEIALASDFEMFQQFNSNPNDVENFMLNTLALVQTNYDTEFANEINFFVTDTYIATSNASDPWTNDTNAGTLLGNFRSWGNDGNFCNDYDVATLWTARNLDGSTVGIAYRPGACSGSRYNVCQYFTTNNAALRVLWAHEIGHNLSSPHDGSGGFIMSPSVNITNQWSTASVGSIDAFVANNQDCFSTCPTSNPVASAQATTTQACAGSRIGFFDETGEGAYTYEWQFPGGTPSSSIERNPIVTYNNPGNFTATLTVSNSFGSANTQVPVSIGIQTNDRVLFFENFEKGFGEISVINPDGSFGWQRGTVVGNDGQLCAFLNNYDYNAPGQEDILQLPPISLTGLSNAVLEIEYAYSPYNDNFVDLFHVDVTGSSAGGGTTRVFTSDENFPTRPAENGPRFIPEDETDWCEFSNQCLEIDLSNYDGQTVTIDLVNENGYGNYLFLDNIVVRASCEISLPVEWLSFRATPDNNASVLNWSVNQDELHAGFYVQKASVGEDNRLEWNDIAWVPSTGFAGDGVAYQYKDQDVRSGQTYLYRLMQQDLDGSTSFSEIREVTFGKAEEISIWPNPVLGIAEIETPFSDGTYQLLDPLGREVQSGIIGNSRTSIDMSALPRAVYWLRVEAQGQSPELIRLVKR
ncbi:MAG: M12 family metallo-peptidase [Bacteroidota bacterium]